jgi:hypothetical protein
LVVVAVGGGVVNLGRCPVCHSRLHLDALVQDDAGRELLGLLAGLDSGTGRALVLYLSLFRPARRDLSNERAARLAREALALGEGQAPGVLAQALADTVEAIRKKGQTKPMENHHYLREVIGSCAARAAGGGGWPARPGEPQHTAAPSKTLLSLAELDKL